MKRLLFLLLFFCLSFAQQSHACSPITAGVFKPTLERWDQHPGPKQQDPTAAGDHWERVPRAIVEVHTVRRGSGSIGHSCNDFGVIVLEISLPETSNYDIRDFGVYTRVIGGVDPDEIFPAIPLVGYLEEGKVLLHYVWLDGAPGHLKPLDMNVELFLITNGLDVGPSTFFQINSQVGGN